MLIEFPEFEDFLMSRNRKGLLIKGKQFLDEGRIQHIHAFSGTEWDVFVTSESGLVPGYNVRIKINEGQVTYHDCNCPGYRMMPLCKHIVAALYAIKEKNLYDPNIGEYQTEYKESEISEIEEEDVAERDNKIYDQAMQDEESKGSKSQQKKQRNLRRKPADNDLIDQELQCQICHELVEHPVLMPCHDHSVCQSCIKSSLKSKDENDKTITCPKCGVSGNAEEKVNMGLERVRHSIEKERRGWLGEKEKLQKEIESLKDGNKGKENEEKQEKGKGKIMEEGIYKKILEENDNNKLRNLANMAVEELKRRGEKLDGLKKAFEGEGKEVKKSVGKKGDSGKRGKPDKTAKNQENMIDESHEGAEKYELRDRKKVKTDGQ